MKLKAITLLAVLLPAITMAAVESQPVEHDISGTYNCNGLDPYYQLPYTSIMTISHVHGHVYAVSDQTMTVKTTNAETTEVFSTRSTGIFSGNVLAIAYQNRRNPMEQGVEQVTFSSDWQSFYGIWAQVGGMIEGTESCKLNPKLSVTAS